MGKRKTRLAMNKPGKYVPLYAAYSSFSVLRISYFLALFPTMVSFPMEKFLKVFALTLQGYCRNVVNSRYISTQLRLLQIFTSVGQSTNMHTHLTFYFELLGVGLRVAPCTCSHQAHYCISFSVWTIHF